jgi:hypothetical protein
MEPYGSFPISEGSFDFLNQMNPVHTLTSYS